MKNDEAGFNAMCKYWASPEFIEMSRRGRQNRGHEAKHTYGADGHIRMIRLYEL